MYGKGVLIQLTNTWTGSQTRAKVDLPSAIRMSVDLLTAASVGNGTCPAKDTAQTDPRWMATGVSNTVTLTLRDDVVASSPPSYTTITMGPEDAQAMAQAITDATADAIAPAATQATCPTMQDERA